MSIFPISKLDVTRGSVGNFILEGIVTLGVSYKVLCIKLRGNRFYGQSVSKVITRFQTKVGSVIFRGGNLFLEGRRIKERKLV